MTWGRKEYFCYRASRTLSTLVTLIFLRPKVIGKENIPKNGMLVIAPNHRSMLDIPVLGYAIFRPMRFMAKKDLFKNRFLKWYFETNGSFSIDKSDSDPAAVKKAVNVLKGGDLLVVFPEGKRNKAQEIGEMMSGAGFIAIKAKAPILPVAISGVDKPFQLKKKFIPTISRAKIVIGKPIISHLENTNKTSIALNELLPELKSNLQSLYEESLNI